MRGFTKATVVIAEEERFTSRRQSMADFSGRAWHIRPPYLRVPVVPVAEWDILNMLAVAIFHFLQAGARGTCAQ